MNEDTLTLGDIVVSFNYERRQAEPEVGYLVDYWHIDMTKIELCNDNLNTIYDIMILLSVEDLARIDEKIENYLNNK